MVEAGGEEKQGERELLNNKPLSSPAYPNRIATTSTLSTQKC
ncbi:hypothetical protein COO91_00573 [Nostoc flagelliforme CCNUN1]|uniref:Uncharacterized protein n=1 Tax=Nostoc flagelliforme CCNUN1 TaxID=2038116 RepID=A0A2K8SH00_9NOSO|nr:hypothetical protein COO91_00573 [Nostoc flagelliforme CCNUN1]